MVLSYHCSSNHYWLARVSCAATSVPSKKFKQDPLSLLQFIWSAGSLIHLRKTSATDCFELDLQESRGRFGGSHILCLQGPASHGSLSLEGATRIRFTICGCNESVWIWVHYMWHQIHMAPQQSRVSYQDSNVTQLLCNSSSVTYPINVQTLLLVAAHVVLDMSHLRLDRWFACICCHLRAHQCWGVTCRFRLTSEEGAIPYKKRPILAKFKTKPRAGIIVFDSNTDLLVDTIVITGFVAESHLQKRDKAARGPFEALV